MVNLNGPSRPAAEQEDDTPASSYDFDNLEVDSPELKGKLAVLRVGSERSDSNC